MKAATGPIPDDRGRVLTRGHGFPVDHIALAVPETQAGVRHVEDLTGVRPYFTKRDPKDFYWSGAVAIAEDSFLEVIGPNPDHRGFHPFKSAMAGLKQPTLMFWYVATDDFDVFARRVAAAGARLDHVVTVDAATSANKSDYTRAVIGPGFLAQRPSVIEWRKRSAARPAEAQCRLTDFFLSLPEPDELNALFAALGINVAVARGPSRIGIALDTPKGEVVIEDEGYALTPLRMIGAMLRRPFG